MIKKNNMNPSKYAVTFACYNQVEYTQKCIESMVKHGLDLSRLIAVDNASSDDTRDYLQSLSLGGCVLNRNNLGCGVAWNQGALALQAEWTIVMNNDVIVSKDWIENLIATSEKNNLKIISPALVEGELDYDFESFSQQATAEMKDVLRVGSSHAVCWQFMILFGRKLVIFKRLLPCGDMKIPCFSMRQKKQIFLWLELEHLGCIILVLLLKKQ